MSPVRRTRGRTAPRGQPRLESEGAVGSSAAGLVPATRFTRDIIGTDDRQSITNTLTYPYRAICHLVIQFGDEIEVGTGFLVGPRLLLTAGHCIYSRRLSRFATAITVSPGLNGQTMSSVRPTATYFVCSAAWIDSGSRARDVGAIFLRERLGDTMGWFGVYSSHRGELSGLQLQLCGYPGSSNAIPRQFSHSGFQQSDDFDPIAHVLDATEGQSGSPLFVRQGETYAAVGVHTRGEGQVNRAARIDGEIASLIKGWSAAAEKKAGVRGVQRVKRAAAIPRKLLPSKAKVNRNSRSSRVRK